MKTLTFLFFLSPFLLFHCSAQPPAWVSALTNAYLKVNVNSITHWEEKQMTFYNINEQGDSTTVNALYVEGSTKEGNKFTGKIPVTNHAVNPVGAFDITGEAAKVNADVKSLNLGRPEDVFVPSANLKQVARAGANMPLQKTKFPDYMATGHFRHQ